MQWLKCYCSYLRARSWIRSYQAQSRKPLQLFAVLQTCPKALVQHHQKPQHHKWPKYHCMGEVLLQANLVALWDGGGKKQPLEDKVGAGRENGARECWASTLVRSHQEPAAVSSPLSGGEVFWGGGGWGKVDRWETGLGWTEEWFRTGTRAGMAAEAAITSDYPSLASKS